MTRFEFFVNGKPQAQGNHRIAKRSRFSKSKLYDSNKNLKQWRRVVARAAVAEGWVDRDLLDGPVQLSLDFYYPRPKSHYCKGGLRKNASPWPHKTGSDLDKLVRAIGDALTGVVWTDDRRIVWCTSTRNWGSCHGVRVTVHWV